LQLCYDELLSSLALKFNLRRYIMGLLNDLFLGVDPPRKRDVDFENVIQAVTVEMGLTVEDDFILRIVQLSELMAIRHCIFLMGCTGGGRTEAGAYTRPLFRST
jgi:hypothetical protein